MASQASSDSFDREARSDNATKGKASGLALRVRLSSPSYQKAATSGKAECIVKVASHARGFRVKKLMEYVARTEPGKEPVELQTENGTAYMGKDDVLALYKEFEKDFDRKTPGTKRTPRHATHVILSGNIENTAINRQKLLSAGSNVAAKHFGDRGYKYVLALHEEGGKAHIHAVVANKHRENGPKLRLNPPQLLELRTDLGKEMTALGLEHVATLRRDRPQIAERVRSGIEQIQKRENQFQRRMQSATPAVDAFKHRQAIARNIVSLRQAVKSETMGITSRRPTMLAALRDLERQLIVPISQADLVKHIDATITHFEKDIDRFRGFVQEFKDPEITPSGQMKDRQKSIAKLAGELEDRIRDARLAIATSDAPKLEKKASMELLKQYEKEVKASYKDPYAEVKPSPKGLEAQIYHELKRLDERDKKFNQDFRFGRADRSPEEHQKATLRAVSLIEERIKEKTLLFNKDRADYLERLDTLRASCQIRAEVFQGIKNLEENDSKHRRQLIAGTAKTSLAEHKDKVSVELIHLRALTDGNDQFNDKDKAALGTSFARLEKIQEIRGQVIDLADRDKKYFARIEKGQGVEWTKEAHSRVMAKAMDTTRKEIKDAKLSYEERKALFLEVNKTQGKVNRDRIRTIGATEKIKTNLARLEKIDRQHWQGLGATDTAQVKRHTTARDKALAEIRERIKDAKLPTEERQKLYKTTKRVEFNANNRENRATIATQVKAEFALIVKQDKAFYLSSPADKLQPEHQKQVKERLVEIRKQIQTTRFPEKERIELYRQAGKAEWSARANQTRLDIKTDTEKRLVALVKANDQFKAPGQITRKEFEQHRASMQKELSSLRIEVQKARFAEQERRELFKKIIRAEAQIPKVKKLMTPEIIVQEMKRLGEEYLGKASGFNATKKRIYLKQVQRELEKKLDTAIMRISQTPATDGEKLKAKRQLYKLESTLGLGRNRGR